MSNITYSSTKGEIWKHCKELRTQLAKAEKAASDKNPTAEVALEPTRALAIQPVVLVADDSLEATRRQVQRALTAFQEQSEVLNALRNTLSNVHDVAFEGPETLTELCAEYEQLLAGNEATSAGTTADRNSAFAEAKQVADSQLEGRREAIHEDRRRLVLAFDRESTSARTEAGIVRKALNDEVRNIATAGEDTANLILSDAEAAWSVAETTVREEHGAAQQVLIQAADAPGRITKATSAGTAQGQAIAAKQVKAAARIVAAATNAEINELREDVEAAQAAVEVSSVRVSRLQTRVDAARQASITLAQQSVTSQSAQGALTAVSEIALRQASGTIKAK